MSKADAKYSATSPRRESRGKDSKRKSRGAKREAKKPSKADVLARPMSKQRARIQAVSNWVVGILLIGGLVALVHYSGARAKLLEEWVALVGRAGFEVRKVEIIGADQLDRIAIYDMVLKHHNRSMAAVDIDAMRTEILQYGWVAEARVSRRFPDRLVVDITERAPSAVWQSQGELSLIDREGVVIEALDKQAMDERELPDLPRLIGRNANHHAEELQALLAPHPNFAKLLAGASWVGNRRWDLHFHSGEVLLLPEGQEAAAQSLAQFIDIDRANRLLGRGIVRFDMRHSSRLVLRLPSSEDAAPQSTESATGGGL